MSALTPLGRAPPTETGRFHRARIRWAAALLVLGLLLVLGVSQLVLPGIAADRLRDSLSHDGQGVHVSVSATPAIELLFGHADAVTVAADRLTADQGRARDLIDRAAKTDSLDAAVDRLTIDGLTLSRVSLRKRGDTVSATATVSRSALESVLPVDLHLDLGASHDGNLVIAGDFSGLGRTLAASAIVTAADGAIELSPNAPFLSSLIHLTIFRAPGFSVDRLSAAGSGDDYRLTAVGHYD